MRLGKPVRQKGFSLTELLAIVAIVGLMGAAVAPTVVRPEAGWKVQVDRHYRSSINTAVERYYLENGRWPAADLSDFAYEGAYFPEGIPVSPLTGKPYELDPATHRVK